MYTSPSLVGAVMLETMWSTRQKDLLDLISPFINYSIAHHSVKRLTYLRCLSI